LKQGGFPVNHVYNALEVIRAAYYQWSGSKCCQRELTNRELSPIIRNVFRQHLRHYSPKRNSVELQSMGYSCSRSNFQEKHFASFAYNTMDKEQASLGQFKTPRISSAVKQKSVMPEVLQLALENRCNEANFEADFPEPILAPSITHYTTHCLYAIRGSWPQASSIATTSAS
jgi:hypothetical protein